MDVVKLLMKSFVWHSMNYYVMRRITKSWSPSELNIKKEFPNENVASGLTH